MATAVGKSALQAVSVGLRTIWWVSPLTSLASFGIYDSVPRNVRFPHIRYELREIANDPDASTMGRNGKMIGIRAHTFTQVGTTANAWAIVHQLVAKINPVGNYSAIVVSGYTTVHVWYDGTDDGPEEAIGGVPVEHLISEFRWLGVEA